MIHRAAGEGGGYLFTSSLPPYPLCRHLNISWTTIVETSPLHIASSQTNLESLTVEHKSLTTKLHALTIAGID